MRLLPLVGTLGVSLALRPKADSVEPEFPTVVEAKVGSTINLVSQEPATTETAETTAAPTPAAATPTGIWHLHHTTTKHDKAPGFGYSYGSPLYGQNQHTIEKLGAKNIPVSTTMKCIITMCAQFFLIMTLYIILKTHKDLSGAMQPSTALVAVNASKATLQFIPMVCVLLLAVRMRALQLSQGDPEKWKLPSEGIQDHMWLATSVFLVQAFIVLASPLIGRVPEVDADGNLVIATPPPGAQQPQSMQTINKVMVFARVILLATLWWALMYIIIGAWVMEPPRPIWGPRSDFDNENFPWPAPAVRVTMDMTSLFFMVYGFLAIAKEINPVKYSKAIALAEVAVNTVKLAPMFCILFIGARMRALQMDPMNGKPQEWAQHCMLACSSAMEVQILAIIVVGCCLKGQVLRGNCEGDIRFKVANPTLLVCLDVLRWVCSISIYACGTAVLYSVSVIEHPKAPEVPTPPVSPAMRCVMILTVLYFIIYCGRFIIQSVRQFKGDQVLRKSAKAFDQAATTIVFAPIMSVLFIGVRMRALLITGQKGAPPGYAQDWMYLSTWMVSLQVFFVLLMGIFSNKEMDVDEEGNLKPQQGGSQVGRYVLESFRYLCLIGMYGGGSGLCYALWDMTPANANGTGSLFPWGPLPEPVNPADAATAATATTTATPASSF